MRDLVICLLFVFAAVLLNACGPTYTARKTVDTITRSTQAAEVGLKRTTKATMATIAVEEGGKRSSAMKAAGCSAAAATQPASTLTEPCRAVAQAAEERAHARLGKVADAASKVQKVITVVYVALLGAVDVIMDMEAGAKPSGWQAKLAAVVAEVVKQSTDLVYAYEAFKVEFGGKP